MWTGGSPSSCTGLGKQSTSIGALGGKANLVLPGNWRLEPGTWHLGRSGGRGEGRKGGELRNGRRAAAVPLSLPIVSYLGSHLAAAALPYLPGSRSSTSQVASVQWRSSASKHMSLSQHRRAACLFFRSSVCTACLQLACLLARPRPLSQTGNRWSNAFLHLPFPFLSSSRLPKTTVKLRTCSSYRLLIPSISSSGLDLSRLGVLGALRLRTQQRNAVPPWQASLTARRGAATTTFRAARPTK